MTKVVYEIVEHDGGWAYRMDGAYSETFPTHSDALQAARIAAAEQQVGDEDTEINYQDEAGRWHEECSQGGDRPEAEVVDSYEEQQPSRNAV